MCDKQCSICKKYYPKTSEFFRFHWVKIKSGKKQYPQGRCKKCERIYTLNYQRTHREWSSRMSLESWRKSKIRMVGNECLICGENRILDICHVIPRNGRKRSRLDKDVIGLCPNHHRLFDRHLLTQQEYIKIEKVVNKLIEQYG